MKKLIIVGVIICGVLFSGCGFMTKSYGGKTTIELPPGEKLCPYTVQWEPKGANIWYLTEPMEKGYVPKTYHFREKSNYGQLEGEIVFIEK